MKDMVMGKNSSRRRVAIEALILGLIVAVGVFLERRYDHAWVETVIQLIVLTAAPAPTLFALYYNRQPWRERAIGRALMAMAVTLSVLLWFIVSALFTGPYEGRDTVRIVIYSLVWYALWRLFATLRKSQRKATRLQHQLAAPRQNG